MAKTVRPKCSRNHFSRRSTFSSTSSWGGDSGRSGTCGVTQSLRTLSTACVLAVPPSGELFLASQTSALDLLPPPRQGTITMPKWKGFYDSQRNYKLPFAALLCPRAHSPKLDKMAYLTERGNQVKRVGGFEYVLRKDRMGKNGELTWRCRENVKFKCPASIRTLQGIVLDGQGNPNHSHPGDPLTGEVRQVQSHIRSAATAGQESTRSILAENMTGLSQDVLQRLPKRSTLEDSVRAKRRATNPVEPNSQSLNFAIPARFTDIVLHDSGSQDPSRILILGDMNLLHVLENAEHPSIWKLMDGLKKDISLHLKTLADNEVANNPPPRNKYIVLSERLAARVDCYNDVNDKLHYLRSVAHIFSN
ncbi:hypothetical protein O3P69_019072 [Scylla paramamosain]|uniref:FLYWCH-type domain-containing protein n=1 Tax=Scylla paramamosain TaxID=85552 RepID=A0AAW0T9N3_SCYPA